MAILVVDDSRAMRLIVRRELQRAGYEDVVEADSGRAGLDAIHTGGVALVLSDWNMPEISGFDFLRAVRAEGNDVIFGLVTAESDADKREQALRAGADFLVTKPFTGDDLKQQIDIVLGVEAAGDSEGLHRPVTLKGELAGLLNRRVEVRDAGPPQDHLARAVATYTIPRGSVKLHCVVEMPLAASLGCALGLIPPTSAAEYAQASDLPEQIGANFHEVANVITKVAPSGDGHCALTGVQAIPPGRTVGTLQDANRWIETLEVEIEGYPSGRLGFVGL